MKSDVTTGRGNYACMGIPALGNGLLRAAEAANCILLAVSLILAHPPPVQEQT